MEALNDYAGLFALLALVAAIIVPYIIYRWQKKDERQKMQDEYDALQRSLRVPLTKEQREIHIKQEVLEKQLKRK